MKYLVLLMGEGDEVPWEEQTDEQQAASMARFEAFDAACAEADGVTILAGEALGPPEMTTVMRTKSEQVTLTDGPYAEAVEGLGGFYLVEAPDLDTLVGLLGRLPAYDIQIQPAVDPV